MLAKSLFRKPKNELEGQVSAAAQEKAVACPGCKKQIMAKELEQSLMVCPRCGHHMRLGARQRIAMLLNENSFCEMDAELTSSNVLDFPGYVEKLEAARRESGEKEAVITGTARIGDYPCAFFTMEPGFMMGSMGTVVGEKLTRLFEYATQNNLPVIGCTVSGGARMQEGILSLMQMTKVSAAVRRHSDAGNLYIVLLTDPTTGGVTASFAMEGDIILAEPGTPKAARRLSAGGISAKKGLCGSYCPQGYAKGAFDKTYENAWGEGVNDCIRKSTGSQGKGPSHRHAIYQGDLYRFY